MQIDLSSLQLPAAQQQPASSAAQASPGAAIGGSTYITASGNSDGLSSNVSSLNRGLFTLISAGLDNRVLQWDLASGPSVLNSLSVDSEGSELSAMTFLQNWAILATGNVVLLDSICWHCSLLPCLLSKRVAAEGVAAYQ